MVSWDFFGAPIETEMRREKKPYTNYEGTREGKSNEVQVTKSTMTWIHNLKCSLHTLKHKLNTINVLLIKLLSSNLVPYNIAKKS